MAWLVLPRMTRRAVSSVLKRNCKRITLRRQRNIFLTRHAGPYSDTISIRPQKANSHDQLFAAF